MSEFNTASGLREMLNRMPTEQLDKMLQAELEQENPDPISVRMLLGILEEQEKEHPVAMNARQKQALTIYQSRMEKKPKRLPRILLQASSLALVLLILISLVPQEARAETFWERLERWTIEVVEFFSPSDNKGRLVDYQFQTENPGLRQVYDAVVELGVTDPVVPMWLPEGYELVECKASTASRKNGVHALFSNGSNNFIFKVDIYTTDAAHKFYKVDTTENYYEAGGVHHDIVQNNGRYTVIWSQENRECSIAVDCQEDILYRILKSIYTNGE